MASSGSRVDESRFSLSVVVPVYNEVAVLPEFHRRLGAVLILVPLAGSILALSVAPDESTPVTFEPSLAKSVPISMPM